MPSDAMQSMYYYGKTGKKATINWFLRCHICVKLRYVLCSGGGPHKSPSKIINMRLETQSASWLSSGSQI